MTGNRLRWILEDLFEAIAKTSIEPFYAQDKVTMVPGSEGKESLLRKCLEVKLRG